MQDPFLKFDRRLKSLDKRLPSISSPVEDEPVRQENLHRLTYEARGNSITLETTDRTFLEEQRVRIRKTPFRPAILDGEALPDTTDQRLAEPEKDRPLPPAAKSAHPVSRPTSSPVPSPPQADKRPRLRLKVNQAPQPIKRPDIDFAKLLEVARLVKQSRYADRIEERIIRSAPPIDRILLSSYFGEKVFSEDGLTAAHLEAITKALGAGLSQPEIYRQLMRYNSLYAFTNPYEAAQRISLPRYRINVQGKKKLMRKIKAREKEDMLAHPVL